VIFSEEQDRMQAVSMDGIGRFGEGPATLPSTSRGSEGTPRHMRNMLAGTGSLNPTKDSRQLDILE